MYAFAEHDLDPSVVSAIVKLVDESPGIIIADVIAEGRQAGWSVDDTLAALAQHLVFCNLERFTPDDHVHARLYADAATARAYEAAHAPSSGRRQPAQGTRVDRPGHDVPDRRAAR